MRQSRLIGKTLREPPAGELSANAKLLTQAGYVDKLMAGVYSFLPLGFLVLKNLEKIIREEMQALGAGEVLLPALHPKENWLTTGRWESDDPMYRLKDEAGHEYMLGSTHEEVVTPLMRRDIASYRDLPIAVYQFQTKFRAELRAKSGLLRGREFPMKDLYSFHADEADLMDFYERVMQAYQRIFARAGIGDATVVTYASGGSFSTFSHEFQALTQAGEDTIYLCSACRVAINKEIIATQPACPSCGADRATLREERAIEVGNIFPLKTRFSDPFRLTYVAADGTTKPVLMGCYGIGLSRLMGAIAEVHHDERGLVWPQSVAPFRAHLVRLGEDAAVVTAADQLYDELTKAGVSVLYDDRDVSAGVKLNDADLIGLPTRLVVSAKHVAAGTVEWKDRGSAEAKSVADPVALLRSL